MAWLQRAEVCAFSGLKSTSDMAHRRKNFRPTWRGMACRLI
jgi:hypothetical protein